MARRSVRNVFSNDSQALLSCPFCGEDGEIHHMLYPYEAYVPRCSSDGDCLCTLMEFHTRDQAVMAWNTRAERTCEVTEYNDCGPHAEDCTIVLTCGHRTLGYIPNYCPSCGAKVVS